MDKHLTSYVDLPQSSFNDVSTTTYSVPARTITISQSFSEGLQWASILLKASTGVPSFVGATASESALGSPNPQTIPAHNDGDLGLYVLAGNNVSGESNIEENRALIESQGWISIANGTLLNVFYKFLTNSDTQTPTIAGANNHDTYVLVYRNALAPTIAASDLVSRANSNSFTTQAYSDTQQFLIVYTFGGGSGFDGADTAAPTATYPAGVTERVFATSHNTAFSYSYGGWGAEDTTNSTTIPGGTEINVGGNPTAGNTRLRAKFDGSLQARSTAGTDAQVGGGVTVISRTLDAPFNTPVIQVANPVTPLIVAIPPGKKAVYTYLIVHNTSSLQGLAGPIGIGVTISCPEGATGACAGAALLKGRPTIARAADSLVDGDVFSISAGQTKNITNTSSQTTANGDSRAGLLVCTLDNKTNKEISITPEIIPRSGGANEIANTGSSVFVLLT